MCGTVHVGDALAIAELQRFQFVRRQHGRKFVVAHRRKAGAHVGVGQAGLAERGAMAVGDGEKALEELLRIGPAADREKIDQLDEEPRAAVACPPHRLRQAAQTR